jgi:hypothetical protein
MLLAIFVTFGLVVLITLLMIGMWNLWEYALLIPWTEKCIVLSKRLAEFGAPTLADHTGYELRVRMVGDRDKNTIWVPVTREIYEFAETDVPLQIKLVRSRIMGRVLKVVSVTA